MRRLHDVSMEMIHTKTAGGGSTDDPADVGLEDITERDIFSYVVSVTGLYRLMQLELRLLEQVIPAGYQKLIFSHLVLRPLNSVHQEGKSLADRVRRLVQKSSHFNATLYLLPILRFHFHMRHSFDLMLDECEPEVCNLLQMLAVTMQTTVSKSLDEFIDYIKSDVHTRVPKDGTVHELTSNVMLFLVHLHSYLDILSRVVTITDYRSMENSGHTADAKNRVAFAQYISRVLSALGNPHTTTLPMRGLLTLPFFQA